MPSNFHECFSHETCGRENYSEIAKFWAKQRRMDIDQEKLTTFNDDPELLKKIITGDESWVYGYDIEAKAQWSQWKLPEEQAKSNKKTRKKHVKFGQMWRICSLFSSITMAWCIINSCHKVVRPIRNTKLKFYTDCSKQFFRNTQNCGKTNHGFCTLMTHHLTHQCLGVSFWPKTKP